MTKSKDCNFFLSIGPSDIKFEAIDKDNEIFFLKNDLFDNSSNTKNFEILEKFLKNNILDIEKELSNYVENINLVIDHNDFLFVNLSMKYNFDGVSFNFNHLNNSLIELKKYFQNTIGNYEIIHMVINKFVVDGKVYYQLTEVSNFNKICLEIKFICLNRGIVKNLKNILSKYQIFVKNIISYKYLNEFENFNNSKSTIIAQKILNGLNQNEIFYEKKSSKKQSFFEKFFNFFN
jgi:hypothetical protein